jgi:hypothetical protein
MCAAIKQWPFPFQTGKATLAGAGFQGVAHLTRGDIIAVSKVTVFTSSVYYSLRSNFLLIFLISIILALIGDRFQ